MHLTNFTFDSSIEIGYGGRKHYLDLHNCFDWQTITYLSEERRIKMTWTRSSGDWVQQGLPSAFALEFRGVSRFAAWPRDPEMPFTEDSCLASVTFTPPEYASDFKRAFEGYRSDSEHIMFLFMSGFGLKIWAEDVELICDRSV
ncbi:MAG: hypothetical protein ABSA83_07120 [Verrucomicrobiota bacterium]|jgi:hypothetical protein